MTVAQNLDRLVARQKITAAQADAAHQRVTRASGYGALRPADLVIEAVTENVEVKVKVLREFDTIIRRDAIVATNTSSISITRLAAVIARPDCCIGMRFFNPVPPAGPSSWS